MARNQSSVDVKGLHCCTDLLPAIHLWSTPIHKQTEVLIETTFGVLFRGISQKVKSMIVGLARERICPIRPGGFEREGFYVKAYEVVVDNIGLTISLAL